jgi:Zn-dependent protease
MNHRQNPLFWSFGVGTWLGVRLRISWLMPLVLFWFLYEFGPSLGGVIFAGLFISVLLHEIGHILAARAFDGSGEEILLWPFGGLAAVHQGLPLRAQVITSLSGPLVNLVLCGIFLSAVITSGNLPRALNPLTLVVPEGGLKSPNLLIDLQVLMFSLNWMQLLINLVPVYPLDGGQVLRSALSARFGNSMANEVATRCSMVVGIVVAILAMLVFKNVILLGLAFGVVLLAMQEAMQLHSGESYDDSFMGYDFSQGYTSLEKSERPRQEPRPGLFARWLESRRQEKQRRLEMQQQQVDLELDEILAKVHERGMNALTPSERRLLKRASDRYRSKGQDQR